MTDEQRLKEIRERLALHQSMLPTRDEADFLLSLIDNQAARGAKRIAHKPNTPESLDRETFAGVGFCSHEASNPCAPAFSVNA